MISSKDFFSALDDLEKEKKIDKEYFISALESALTSAYKKDFGEAQSVSVTLNADKNTIKVLAYKTVVDEVVDADKEISLTEAQTIKSSYKVGDIISQEVTPKNFGRIAAQTARQVVMQKLREAERGVNVQDVNTKVEQLTTAIVRRIDGKDVYLELGGFEQEGILTEADQIPNEKFQLGEHIKVCVKKVRDSGNGYGTFRIPVTRTSAGFVRKLIELEVPDIENGVVEIKSIVREAGFRTKIAVFSNDNNVDPVGACVGNGGSRINSVISEINGEKIDIIRWSDDVFEFIAKALSPAEVVSVEIDEASKSCKVVVPDNKLSLAIGKGGMNVRLAVKLTGWKIDVKSESVANEITDNGVQTVTSTLSDNKVDDLDIFEDLKTID